MAVNIVCVFFGICSVLVGASTMRRCGEDLNILDELEEGSRTKFPDVRGAIWELGVVGLGYVAVGFMVLIGFA